MRCYIFLIAAGALMPVVVGIVLPLAAVAMSMLTAAGCLICHNNGFVFVHRNIQSIARYRCCSTVHRNDVDFIANFRGKGNRFG